ncbi:MAG: isoprenylcysteine carboxylmethyltransferase family protein [candidate division Zixibacteria bacterium]|nr:isoprenylcysteine carboxylmethyltransferase family protein [candidate division Zixibacteria bacterium]NIV05805.1 isoprenylcysteine carboxylmethyltransferase family protein [candidate division Zixibacteria bacterium]
MTTARLVFSLIFSIIFIVIFLGAVLLLPAGNLYWMNGWIFIGSMVGYLLLIFIYFGIKDPATLERRSKLSQEEGDALHLTILGILFTVMFLIPPFDYRFGWSQLPDFLAWVGLVLLIISYLIIFFVMRENSYASKGLRIHEGQKVIDSGPYSIIRHPMYAGFSLMCISIPLTLGSLLAFIPALLFPLILAPRIKREEAMLMRELEGYKEYKEQVQYRMLPGIW